MNIEDMFEAGSYKPEFHPDVDLVLQVARKGEQETTLAVLNGSTIREFGPFPYHSDVVTAVGGQIYVARGEPADNPQWHALVPVAGGDPLVKVAGQINFAGVINGDLCHVISGDGAAVYLVESLVQPHGLIVAQDHALSSPQTFLMGPGAFWIRGTRQVREFGGTKSFLAPINAGVSAYQLGVACFGNDGIPYAAVYPEVGRKPATGIVEVHQLHPEPDPAGYDGSPSQIFADLACNVPTGLSSTSSDQHGPLSNGIRFLYVRDDGKTFYAALGDDSYTVMRLRPDERAIAEPEVILRLKPEFYLSRMAFFDKGVLAERLS